MSYTHTLEVDHPGQTYMFSSPKKHVIMLNGLKRSGKDYTADALRASYIARGKTVEVLSFAAPMKQIIANTFNITPEDLDTYKNDEYDDCRLIHYSADKRDFETDFRSILQRFGNEGMKPIFGDDVWASATHKLALPSKADVIIIADYRFDIEFDTFVKSDAYELTTVYIQGAELETPDTHISEKKPERGFDYIVDNTKQDDTVANWVMAMTGDLPH